MSNIYKSSLKTNKIKKVLNLLLEITPTMAETHPKKIVLKTHK